jgi:hypothetical protein
MTSPPQPAGTATAALVGAGARSELDLLRVPMNAAVVAALGSIGLVASRWLPDDAWWDRAVGHPRRPEPDPVTEPIIVD